MVEPEETVDSSPADNFGLDAFLTQIPADLRPVYQESFKRWLAVGGKFHITSTIIYWEITLGDQVVHASHCDWMSIAIVRPKDFDQWCKNHALYQRYLKELESSPLATAVVRAGKKCVPHNKLSANELKIILNANINLVGWIKAEQMKEPT